MSNTPETDAFIESLKKRTYSGGIDRHAYDNWDYECAALTSHARKLERERGEARVQFGAAEGLGLALVKTINELKKERDEANAQMCQAIGYLSTVAEDCEAWLNGESDEPSMDFIKAVRDYAKKAI